MLTDGRRLWIWLVAVAFWADRRAVFVSVVHAEVDIVGLTFADLSVSQRDELEGNVSNLKKLM